MAVFPSFGANWLDGASGNLTDNDCWEGGTAPTSGSLFFVNTSGNVSYVTNDVSGTSWSGDYYVNSGAWEFSGSFPKNSNAVLIGAENQTVSVVNYSSWDTVRYFTLGYATGATVVYTNRAGTIRARGEATGNFVIGGRAGNSNQTGVHATMVFEGGTLIAMGSSTPMIAYGKQSVGKLLQKGGEMSFANRLMVGGYGEAHLTMEGGTLTIDGDLNIANNPAAPASFVTLKGGVLSAKNVSFGSSTSGTSTFTFDGGTLNLTASHSVSIARNARLAVSVGEHGGRIALGDGVAAVVPADIGELSGSTGGGLTIGGAGSISFTGALSYTGTTTVELGATVIVPSPSAIPGAFTVAIPATPPADGLYTLLSTTGGDTLETFFASVTLPTSDPKAVFRLSADKKSIICLYGDVEQTWIGGASGDLGDATKWSTGLVPTSGNAIITSGSAATLTSNAAFTPDAITFPVESALVTINGEAAIANLLAITNNALQHHVFNCPVSFRDGTAAEITSSAASYLDFAGGMTAYALRKKGENANIKGDITLTNSDMDWNRNGDADLIVLLSGTHLTIPSMKNSDAANFSVGSGATLTVNSDLRFATNVSRNIIYKNDGLVEVNGIIDASAHRQHLWFAEAASAGFIKARGLVSPSVNNNNYRFVVNVNGNTGKWAIGASGLTGNGQYYLQKDRSVTITASEDYAIDCALTDNNTGTTWTFNTTDYEDGVTPRTVTVNKGIGIGAVVVNGVGTMLFNVAGGTTRGLTANDSATIAVNVGKQPCNGAVMMNGTSTLKVAQSGTVTLGGNLTLGATATLAFNFTDRLTAPTLALASGKTATLPATVNVKISANDGVWPSSSRTHTLTSNFAIPAGTEVTVADLPDWVKSVEVVDGNLVLAMKPKGMIVVIK